jgi:hypothetical protein
MAALAAASSSETSTSSQGRNTVRIFGISCSLQPT